MSISELLLRLKNSDIHLDLSGDDIEVNFDGEELPAGFHREILDNKPAIVAFLKEISTDHTIGLSPERSERALLSYAQERLWFIDKLNGSVQYHMPTVYRVRGELDRERLERSFREILNRHESLRTVIRQHDGKAYQHVLPPDSWQLGYHKRPGKGMEGADLGAYIADLIASPFDLAADYMFRADLIPIDDREHILLWTMHHIASDGWSLGILVRELTELYDSYREGRIPWLAKRIFQYSDFALWQRRHLSGERLETQLKYWKEVLTGAAPLELPTDFIRPPEQSSRGGVRVFRLSAELRAGLQELSRRQRATLFMTLLAAFDVLLYRYSGQNDICVGIPVAGRTQQEWEELIGFFVNTLALRIEVKGDVSFRSLLAQVKEATLEAYEHQDAPFEKVVEKVMKERDMSRNPLVQAAFTLQNTPDGPPLKLGEALLSHEGAAPTTSQFDIHLYLTETSQGIWLAIEYSADLFKMETIDRMGNHYAELLNSIVKDADQKVGDLKMLTRDEEQLLVSGFNDTEAGYPRDKSIVDLFTEQAALIREHPAVIFENQQLSYRQLEERSNQLGHYLREHGVKEDTPVGICLDRGPDMIVGLLGILKAGGAYVPIDPEYPTQRIEYILQDTAAPVLLTNLSCYEAVPASYSGKLSLLDLEWGEIGGRPVTRPAILPQPHHLAYIIYTSGSTGNPKGVMAEHRNVVNLLFGFNRVAGPGQQETGLSVCSYTFDVSVWEFFINLCFGHSLHIVKSEHVFDPAYLGNYFIKNNISTAYLPPTILPGILDFLESSGDSISLKRLLVGVMPIKQNVLQRFCDKIPGIDIINGYGPTEATICATFFPFRKAFLPEQPTPIGKPVMNDHIYILEPCLSPAPVGVTGELYIGGEGLTRGYLNQPELTTGKFVADTFSRATGARLYRTGDLGRWLPDGNIEFLGRKDEQVKIRGYRIEPGEIETALLQSGLVRQCVVLTRPDVAGNLRLVAYVVQEGAFDRQQLISGLRNRLPGYMVPALWVSLKSIPLTINGKIDKQALPEPDASALLPDQYEAPRSEAETALAEIWQDLLGVERVGIHDNFFELGGDSIITIQVASRARQIGYDIHPKDVFLHQTIERLALALLSSSPLSAVRAEQGLLHGEAGLLPIQHYYLEQEKDNPHIAHFNQSLLVKIDKSVGQKELSSALDKLTERHDALRYRYEHSPAGWRQSYGSHAPGLIVCDLQQGLPDTLAGAIRSKADHYQRSLNMEKGELIRAVWILTPATDPDHRLLFIIHHLAVDGVSWGILLEDLHLLLKDDHPIGLKTSSCRDWRMALGEYAQSRRLSDQVAYWKKLAATAASTRLPVDNSLSVPAKYKDQATVTVHLSPELTRLLLQEAPAAYHTEINDLLLAALARVLCQWAGHQQVIIGLEGHGREESIAPGIDLSHTVGWFTSLYPALLEGRPDASLADLIKGVKEGLRSIPDKGLGYGVLKYIHPTAGLSAADHWEVIFNYFGQTDAIFRNSKRFSPSSESSGQTISDEHTLPARLSVNSRVTEGQLLLHWSYSQLHYRQQTIRQLADAYIDCLTALIGQCRQQRRERPVFTPSDYGLGAVLTWQELDRFLEKLNSGNLAPSLTSLYRLSGLQEGMLFHSQYEEGVRAYVGQFKCQLAGVTPALLINSWELLLQRYSILRTAFYSGDFRIPVQAVFEKVDLPVTLLDLRQHDESNRLAVIRAFEETDRAKGFDLSRPPLMRIALFRTGENDYRMIWTLHHLILDGWSVAVLLAELQQIYESLEQGGQPPAKEENSYGDHIRYIESRDKEEEESFWRAYLSGAGRPILLPFIRHTKDRNKGVGRYAEESIRLDKAFTAALYRYAQRQQLTVNTVMQGIWAYLLSRYTAETDITYGVTVSGRSGDLPGMEQRVGMYINTVPLHTHIDESALTTEWLQSLQAGQVASRQHQYSWLSDIQKWAGIKEDWFDSLLIFENYPVSRKMNSVPWRLQMTSVQTHEQTNYPLTIVVGGGEALQIGFRYNERLLEAQYVQQIAGHFREVMRQLVEEQPVRLADLQILTQQERQLLLNGFNATVAGYPREKTIVDLFSEQAAAAPDPIAIVFEDGELSYRQLDQRSNQLGHYLRELGVREDTPVVLCLDRSFDMIVAILGILKAGGAYVPVDPGYPAQRIDYILRDCAAPVLVTDSHSRNALPPYHPGKIIVLDRDWEKISVRPDVRPATLLQPHHLAYIIYTSGSTGKPKGVLIEHKNVVRLFKTDQPLYDFGPADVWTLFHSFCFDFSVWEIFGALLFGGRLVIVSKESSRDVAAFEKLLLERQVTVLNTTPSAFYVLQEQLTAAKKHLSLRYIIFGGEALDLPKVSPWRHAYPQTRLVNMYGITETTVHVSFQPIEDRHLQQTGSLIGKAIPTLHVQLLDKNSRLVPIGVAGELYIGGEGLARGYLNQPELTADRFPAGAASRLYRSGDLARWLPDGVIEYLGRIDDQVKIRGYRIELGEIESIVQQSGLVRQCVVLARPDAAGDSRLIGYVMADNHFHKDVLIPYLKQFLPEYMVPGIWIRVDSIPLTGNGKIDRESLPAIDPEGHGEDVYIAPGNEVEVMLAEIWGNLLGIEKISMNANFFTLGGHSLLAARMVSIIRKKLETELPIRDVFIYSTIAELAERLMTGMKKALLLLVILFFTLSSNTHAQTLYVDAVKGNDEAKGGPSDPLASLERAADLAGKLNNNEPVTIRVAPGLYQLTRPVEIASPNGRSGNATYTIEAMVMPGDTNWTPAKTPAIQCVSLNNTGRPFEHCVGFNIDRDSVCIKGLKFLGNPNPETIYYYPIERDSSGLNDLEISQCYFLGDKDWAPVQGAVYTQGMGIHVDHCIFFGCKHGFLLFNNVLGFSLTHSIIYGCYGAVAWFGDTVDTDIPFTFQDNIVANCNFFWAVGSSHSHPLHKFSNSLITDTRHFIALTNTGELKPFEGDNGHKEINIRKSGKVVLRETTREGMPNDLLQLAPSSAGRDIDAGVLKK